MCVCVCVWLQYYLEAFRHFVAGRMRVSGGTPQEHVMAIVLKFDKEVRACVFCFVFFCLFASEWMSRRRVAAHIVLYPAPLPTH